MRKSLGLLTTGVVLLTACGEEQAGEGTAKFTTWGEAFIEEGIPAHPDGESGFLDGWSVKYDKFLVVFHGIEVADDGGDVGASSTGSFFVDNTKAGRKALIAFPGLEARSWNRVSYQIAPARADSTVVSGDAADRDMMAENGFSVFVSGTATKSPGGAEPAVTKTFHWGFRTATQYRQCQQAAESGAPIEGIVVTSGGEDTSELTTHGDHLYYDRLKASDDPAKMTSLRFEEKAAADTDGDGEVTMEELFAAPIDVRTYDPSGLPAASLGEFMTALARTIGHFRGEGECTVSRIEGEALDAGVE